MSTRKKKKAHERCPRCYRIGQLVHEVFWLFLGEVGLLSDGEGLYLPHFHQRLGKLLPHVLLPRRIVEGHIKLFEINAKAYKFVEAIVRSSRDRNRFYKCREFRIGPEYVVEDSGELVGGSNDHCIIQQRCRDPEEIFVDQEDG